MIHEFYKMLQAYRTEQNKPWVVKLMDFPDTKDFAGIKIIVHPVTAPKATDYADGTYTAREQIIQIDVWSLDIDDTERTAQEITDYMFHILRAPQSEDGPPLEYDEDTNIYRDARRYRYKKSII